MKALSKWLDTNDKRFWLVILIFVSIVFQLGLWYFQSGMVKIQGDATSYVYLAYEILNEVPTTPIFDMRSPGWPLTIALLLKVFGLKNIWVLGLFHRIVLAVFPVIFFLIISKKWQKRYYIPFLLSLLTVFLPINRDDAIYPLSGITYAFLGLVVLYLISEIDLSKKQLKLFLLLGLVSSYRLMIRIQFFPTILLVFAIYTGLMYLRKQSLKQIGIHLLIGVFPVILTIFIWGGYNKIQTGTFGLSTGVNHQTFFFIRSVDFKTVFVPTTDETKKIRELVPEVREDLMPFSVYPYYWTSLYRSQVMWDMSALEFFRNYASPATNQFLWENRAQFLSYMLKWMSYDIMSFSFSPEDIPSAPLDRSLPFPKNGLQQLGTRINSRAYQTYQNLTSESNTAIFSVGKDEVPLLTREYLNNDYWRSVEASFLFSGLAGMIAMVFLLVYSKEKLLLLGMLSFYFVDLTIPVYACGDCISWGRFQYPLETVCLLAVALLLSELLRNFHFIREPLN